MGNQYSYEDHKDGTHCIYKTACVTKYTSLFAFVLASLDVINLSKPTNIGGILVQYPRYMAPGILSGVVFGLTTCTLTIVRKKDDSWNYFFGGAASGAMMGACRRSFNVGVPCALLFGFASIIYKQGRQQNFVFFPRTKVEVGVWDSMAADYTLTPDRPIYTLDRPRFD